MKANNRFHRVALFALAAVFAGGARAELPPLCGDGVHDDTAAIQARLDSGASLVYLPPPKKEYLISRTLRIGSDTELRLDPLTRIRLAPNSNCPMLQNRDWYYGTNVNVIVSGGIWDFDNLHQEPCPFDFIDDPTVSLGNAQGDGGADRSPKKRLPHPELDFWDPANVMPDWNQGILMRFSGMRNFTVKGITLRNPTTYGLTLNHAVQFAIEHVTFSYDTWNPRPLCMDGVHLDSNCHYGRIAHLRGTARDDMVALLAHDRWYRGPITDVVIEDIAVAEPAFRAVRLLSRSHESPVKRIVIRDVRGKFYTDVVGFTRFWGGGDARGLIEDVLVENLHVSRVQPPDRIRKALNMALGARRGDPLFQFQGGIDVGRAVFRNIVREETDIGSPTFWFNQPAKAREIVLRDVRMVNRTGKAIQFFDGFGEVEKVVVDNVAYDGAWTNHPHACGAWKGGAWKASAPAADGNPGVAAGEFRGDSPLVPRGQSPEFSEGRVHQEAQAGLTFAW